MTTPCYVYDTDILKNKEELLTSLEDFRQGKYDILLGTQMVAKGLNFPNLQLVGVILADAGLHMPDFRAGERTFSLITQVAGRAGRYFPDGKVIVQTYSPGKGPVLYACQNRIEDFYGAELAEREMLDFPPFSRLLRLVFRSFNKGLAAETARDAVKILMDSSNINTFQRYLKYTKKDIKGIFAIYPIQELCLYFF